MKLIKTKSRNRDKNRCSALAATGKQCKRSAEKDGLCYQHYEINKKVQKHVSSYPGGILQQVPDTPENLSGHAANRWRQCCEALLSHNQLKGIYLTDILDMILAEEEYQHLLEEIETQGYLNVYTTETGELGNQINGVWVARRDLEKKIDNYRKNYWMLPDGHVKLLKTAEMIPGKKSQGRQPSKVKNW